ncbi:MAG: cyaA [Sphingomonas bacterium]|uniref:adenylate/guanylate cyclase domain-containing protein n=1 Tax=Sphingomonas bacterium TaxID=1895847 RepID=UPI002615FCD3|nr:adenylate/guanylate cyclase domain-containing protein [Sphingomonas bacterium]MDB5705859.1 cyaA [Sphingomonas bacterium]
MQARRRLGLRALLAAIMIALVCSAGALNLFEPVDGQIFDRLSTLAPARPAEPGALLVAIDEPSFSAIGRQWPWPRDLHAQLLTALRHAGAKVVALDIVFAEPSEADAALARAAGRDSLFAADETIIEAPYGTSLVRTEPLPVLLASGARSGVASLSMDGDGVMRRVPRYPDGFMARLAAMTGATPDMKRQGGRLIQYFGPAGSYPRISYYQALEPEKYLPPGMLKGRVILVGQALQASPDAGKGGTDAFETPWTAATGKLSAGVEVQATILDNLLSGLAIAPAPDFALYLLALLGGLAGWFASIPRAPLRKALLGLAGLAALALLSWLTLRFGRVWASPVAPAAALAAVVMALAALDLSVEQRRRRAIQAAFGHYVAPAVVERLIADPALLNLGGETREMTILFADIRGFTAIAEAMKDDPQGLTRTINAILTPLSEIVLEHRGTIDKYIGDCIMAFWNAPLDDPDHALHGLGAARAMLDAMEAINAGLRAEAGRDIAEVRIGIGLNSGRCVVGNMGSAARFDYSVLGDAVNVAARLEALCKTYEVPLVIGASTAALLPDDIALCEIDRIAVRGRSQSEAIFALG